MRGSLLSCPQLFSREEIDHFSRLVTEYVPFSFYFHSRKLSVLASTVRFTDYRHASQCTRELSVQILVWRGRISYFPGNSVAMTCNRPLTHVSCMPLQRAKLDFFRRERREERGENWTGENHDGNSFVVALND